MDHLPFMQVRDGGVPGLLVKEVEEKNARNRECNRQGNECFFEMGIQLISPAVRFHCRGRYKSRAGPRVRFRHQTGQGIAASVRHADAIMDQMMATQLME